MGSAAAAGMLEGLRGLVPFVAAELSVRDPLTAALHPVATDGYAAPVSAHLHGAAFAEDCAELGIVASGRPSRMRDVPARARARTVTIDGVLRPAGYREGLTMWLRTRDGRAVGVVNLSVDDAAHPTDAACAALFALNATLADACDPLRAARELRALTAPDAPAALLAADGTLHPLPGPALPPDLTTAATAAVPGRHLYRGTAGPLTVTVLPCREPGLPHVRALVLAEPADTRGLTARELEVLALVATGAANGDIAAELVVSVRTVATHVEHILAKLGVATRAAAAALAARAGLLPAPPA